MEDSEKYDKSTEVDTGKHQQDEEKPETETKDVEELVNENDKKNNDPVTILSVEVLATGTNQSETGSEHMSDAQTNDESVVPCGDANDTTETRENEVVPQDTGDKKEENVDIQPENMEEDTVQDSTENSTCKTDEDINSSTPSTNETINEHVEDGALQSTETKHLEANSATVSTTGLSLLAQYASGNEDSDSESVVEVPLPANQDYRNKVVEIDSDSDSDSSSSDSDVECLDNLRKKIEKRMEVDEDDDEDEDDENGKGERRKPKQKIKAKGELLLEDLPPIHELHITVPEDECIELGKIHSIVDQLVLVSALPNSVLLDLDTVLFLDKGQRVLGEVFDVLGQVADPLYCVRFNTNKDINEKNIKVGDTVYVAPKTQYTQFIILSSLMNMKGSDASWENDIEPPPRFLDYSDDEQEQLAKKQLRNRNKPTECDDPEKKARTGDTEEGDGGNDATANRPKASRHQRNQNQRGGRPGQGSSNNQNSYNRPPRHQSPYQQHHQQQMNRPSNHNPSSWHSNYYPQQYPVPPPNYGYGHHQGYPQMPPVQQQNYPQPMYPMPPMGYHAPPPHPHMRPVINNPSGPVPQQPQQMVPGVFNMRPPTMGNFDGHHPPPPGAQ
ncbi:H/ACA ribonucleoprotein complex non-core subunit NAF1 [Musca vetustissima]|uniref:H/ACA ribonucleoprotein complex non-core subunit NAF1 n=1 Tax=Musca vetustissima TaxID=27455 RepID=UPI002AB67E09|nr:H/ACA ribonucleoprotein complex non-core subunit NAF1 [Musca vetustissima]